MGADRDRIEDLIAKGREHYAGNAYDKAEPLLAEAASARPEVPELYNMLGVIYHAQSRFPDAEEAFLSALRLNPAYTEAAVNLSITYNECGKYDQAHEVYTNAVSRHAEAIAAWEQVLRTDPDNKTAQKQLLAIRDGQTPED